MAHRSLLTFLFLVISSTLSAQQLSSTCAVSAVPVIVRAEGVAERMGDILLNCTGPAGREVLSNIEISLSVPLTNRSLTGSNSTILDAVLTINTGTGATTSPAQALLAGTNRVSFNGVRFTPGADGTAQLRITNLRGNVTQTNPGSNIVAQITATSLGVTSPTATVAIPQRGFLASAVSSLVCTQSGSPLPESLTFSQFIAAGTAFSSVRISEGFVSALEPRGPGMDTGVRIVIRYNNVPGDARLFVPNLIAGNRALQPTAAGDYGGLPSGGSYEAGSSTLLLSRVANADANGVGGGVAFAPTGGIFEGLSEITVVKGTGVAVFEVLDSDAASIESAQIPTFLTAPRTQSARNVQIGREVFLGPISTSGSTSSNLPIPRFAPVTPANDCVLRGDCANLIPKLIVPAADPLTFVVTENSTVLRGGRIYVENAGGGVLRYAVRLDYKTGGTSWISIAQESNAVYVLLKIPGLAPGLYSADVVIDGANAGLERIPVTLQVNAAPAAGPPRPTVSSISNGASFASGAVAPGSIVTLKGANFGTSNIGVTFDGTAARILYGASDQINAQVPAELAGSQSSSVIVSANGVQSTSMTVALQSVAPGIFVPGILNQDNTINAASNPATAGTTVQIFGTGLLPVTGQAVVAYKLHDQQSSSRSFVGQAPNLPGIQQINIPIPEYFPTMTTEVQVCSTADGLQACSSPVKISIRQKP